MRRYTADNQEWQQEYFRHLGFNLSIDFSALGVKDPAPFVEVHSDIFYVNFEHLSAVVGLGTMCVDNNRIGVADSSVSSVHTAREVEVLAVHKKALVEQSYFA